MKPQTSRRMPRKRVASSSSPFRSLYFRAIQTARRTPAATRGPNGWRSNGPGPSSVGMWMCGKAAMSSASERHAGRLGQRGEARQVMILVAEERAQDLHPLEVETDVVLVG